MMKVLQLASSKHIRSIGWIVLVCLFLPDWVQGQTKRMTEDEVNVQELYLEANAHKLSGRNDKAKDGYLSVLDVDPDNDAAHYELARIYFYQKDFNQAEIHAGNAVKFAPDNQWYSLLQAQIFESKEQFDKAAGVFSSLREKHPSEQKFYYEEAYEWIKAGQYRNAVDVYDGLEKMIGFDEQLIRKRQAVYLSLGAINEAIKVLEKWRKTHPKNTNIYLLLAELHLSDGNRSKADQTYEQLLKLDPNNAKARFALSEKYLLAGQFEKYLNAIGPIIVDDEVNIDSKIGKLLPFIDVIAQEDLEVKNKVLAAAESLTFAHPENPKAFALYADFLYNSGDVEQAKILFEQTLEMEKGVFTIWEQLMRIYDELGHVEKLVDLTKKALDYYPNKAVVHYFNGVGQFGLNRPSEAVNSFNNALLMSRKHPLLQLDIHHRLARVHYSVGDYSKAARSLDKAESLGGNKIASLMELHGDVAFKLKDIEGAVTYWNAAKQLGANSEILLQKIAQKTLIE